MFTNEGDEKPSTDLGKHIIHEWSGMHAAVLTTQIAYENYKIQKRMRRQMR